MKKTPGRPRQPERDRQIVEAYKTSTGLEVAAKFGVSLRTVRYVVARSRSE